MVQCKNVFTSMWSDHEPRGGGDLAFADMKTTKVADIIASSVSAKAYLLGKNIPADAVAPNAVEVVLAKDGKEVNRGRGGDALGDRWCTALKECAPRIPGSPSQAPPRPPRRR